MNILIQPEHIVDCLTKLVMDMYMINGYLKKQDLGYP
jgi:hypothetical protein